MEWSVWMQECLQRWLELGIKTGANIHQEHLFFYIQENNMSSETCICKFSASQARSSVLECGQNAGSRSRVAQAKSRDEHIYGLTSTNSNYLSISATALYAAFGAKELSNNRGFVEALQESASRTPQTVMPTQVDTSRQACVTCL